MLETEIWRSIVAPEGRFVLPLFHGTSSLFLPSILKEGLGGVNIHQAYRTRERAMRLLALSEAFKDHEEWLWARYCCDRLAGEPSPEYSQRTSGFSYRYGGVFVTPSLQTAIRYATRTPFGSESIQIIYEMLRLLRENNVSIELEDQNLFDTLNAVQSVPVLIMLSSVAIDDLRAEQGGSPEEALSFIASCLGEGDAEHYQTMVQQSNFELRVPIPSEDLRVFRVEASECDYPAYKNAKYFEIQI